MLQNSPVTHDREAGAEFGDIIDDVRGQDDDDGLADFREEVLESAALGWIESGGRTIAFEFLTGTATKQSVDQYCERLAGLAAAVGRDLTLVVRGNAEAARALRAAYKQVVFIDSTAYMRSTKRRRAYLNENGKIAYLPVHTSTSREARALLRHNIHTLRLAAPELGAPAAPHPQARLVFDALPAQQHADDESPQLALFPQ